jgi:Heparinase II/III-like protein/Heparinase II/III N-terminus
MKDGPGAMKDDGPGDFAAGRRGETLHAPRTTRRARAPRLSHLFARALPAALREPLRGDIDALGVLRESARRARAAVALRRERAAFVRGESSGAGARLRAEFASLDDGELLRHFRERRAPRFLAGFETPPEELARLAHASFPREAEELSRRARRIVEGNRWPLLGCGEFDFGADVEWLRDPLSGALWPRDFHADVRLARGDGSDARVLWELNRLGHLVTLAQAYALEPGERLAEKFFAHVASWRAQNPVGAGPAWASAMEAALRAVNLLAAFQVFRRSPLLDAARLKTLLDAFDEHGRFVRAHLEFSHLATSNHYLSDVAGLLWLGLLLPELEAARGWREFGLRELPRELDKQVLPDGAHYESSTSYHRFAAELFITSFLVCRANGVGIGERQRLKLRSMLEYLRAVLRPDGRAPLLGDSDNGRALPLAPRAADEHAFLLALGAALFREPNLKPQIFDSRDLIHDGRDTKPDERDLKPDVRDLESDRPASEFARPASEFDRRDSEFDRPASEPDSRDPEPAGGPRLKTADAPPFELLWLLGGEGLAAYESLPPCEPPASAAFADAGTFVLREADLYLLLNASGAGLKGRGSHAHNDALSVEVSACGASFISDPGTFVYTADAAARQAFRSTRYHSAVEVDGAEQNTTDERTPFRIGDEASPRLLRWTTGTGRDRAEAEHHGYERLPGAITHARAVTFDKPRRFWLVEDELAGAGEHTFRFFFHAARGVRAGVRERAAELYDETTGARLLVAALCVEADPSVEPRWTSRDYGERAPSQTVCWTLRARAPLKAAWALVPLRPGEDEAPRLRLIDELRRGISR